MHDSIYASLLSRRPTLQQIPREIATPSRISRAAKLPCCPVGVLSRHNTATRYGSDARDSPSPEQSAGTGLAPGGTRRTGCATPSPAGLRAPPGRTVKPHGNSLPFSSLCFGVNCPPRGFFCGKSILRTPTYSRAERRAALDGPGFFLWSLLSPTAARGHWRHNWRSRPRRSCSRGRSGSGRAES